MFKRRQFLKTSIGFFGAMGYQIDLKEWRLAVGGLVKKPLKLTYGDDWVKYVDKISFEKS